ncbi:MAG TPA: amylo-alpha-1,6-glucosidase, partial [Polyangiaceae bacterium]|nr:amylo-alpha-1,6-glucosidase [Polyangiaceae bacterium]
SGLRFRFGKRAPMLLCSSVLENNLMLAVDLANPDLREEGGRIPHGTIHIARRAVLEDGTYLERIAIYNYGSSLARFPLRLEIAADFRDIFEVRGSRRPRRGQLLAPEVGASSLRLGYVGLDQRTRVSTFGFSQPPLRLDGSEVSWELALEPHAEFALELSIVCSVSPSSERAAPDWEPTMRRAAAVLRDEEGERTTVHTSNPYFNRWLARSRADLRMLATNTPHGLYPYAGVPWFSTVFGRDGIWTALQMLWLEPALAAGVLRFLSANQAMEHDTEADAEPGKIVHEMRDGEMAALREVPFGRYYGSIDSTPLYLMLAAAYHERTGDLSLIREIWPNLLRAVTWLERYGDSDADGFIEYGKRSSHGLVQQGWKDSHDSVFHRDGAAADGPIALCEVQGYAYAARRGMAVLARALGQPELAQTWLSDAETLRQRFDAAFWSEELGMYALALDGRKRPCEVRSSNAGHCLYTGIALPERRAPLARQLMSNLMFSGWGVRTLASDERRYNPMSYHNGSVWPHDNAIIAEGLAGAGFQRDAARLLECFFEAASFMDFQRLPELFCGFARQPVQEPIRYPVACLPQAWASGASFSLLHAVLGVELDAISRRVTLRHPVLPGSLDWLEIRRLLVGYERIDLRLVRHPEDVGVTVQNPGSGVEVVIIK